MNSLYEKTVYDYIKRILEMSITKYDISVLPFNQYDALDNKITQGQLSFPAVQLFDTFEFVTDINEKTFKAIDLDGTESEYEYNYLDSMPCKIVFSYMVLSDDIENLIEVEDVLQEAFSSGNKLYVEPPYLQGSKVPFYLIIDKNVKPQREKYFYDTIFGTRIFMEVQFLPWFSSKIHPAQLEFDNTIEREFFYRANVLEYFKAKFEKLEASDDIKEKIRCIEVALSEIREVIQESYPYVESFTEVYITMHENKCDAKEAINILNNKKKEENERIINQNKRDESLLRDDPIITNYTDAIILELQSKLSDNNITFFGGSKYFYSNESFPIILLAAQISFDNSKYPTTFGILDSNDCKTNFNWEYSNVKEDGSTCIHTYGLNAFPCRYGVAIRIADKTLEGVNAIKKELEDLYKNDLTEIHIADPHFKGEFLSFNFSLSDKQFKDEQNEDGYYYSTIASNAFIFPYYIHAYEKEDIMGNMRMQERILQQALFCGFCKEHIRRWMVQFEKRYNKYLKEKNAWYEGRRTPEQEAVRSFILYGTPVSREIVNKAFGLLTNVYTELYDNLQEKWPMDKIKNNMQAYINYFQGRRNKLLDWLSMPNSVEIDTRGTPYSNNPRDDFGLEHFIYCIDEEQEPLEEALKDYPSFLEYKMEQYYEEKEIRDAQRDARSRTIGGFVRDSAAVATGVTVGNKLSGNTGRGSGSAPGKANARCRVSCPNFKNGKCSVGSHPSRCQNSW